MNILGLHFGHDAAVCILRDGKIVAYVMRERHSRIKHAISLEFKTIQTGIKLITARLPPPRASN
jgi:carbamoyltransferase